MLIWGVGRRREGGEWVGGGREGVEEGWGREGGGVGGGGVEAGGGIPARDISNHQCNFYLHPHVLRGCPGNSLRHHMLSSVWVHMPRKCQSAAGRGLEWSARGTAFS